MARCGGAATLRYGIAAVICLLQGCLPIPNVERTASELKGVVLNSEGAPLAGISVKRVLEVPGEHQGRECTLPGDTVLTDLLGQFQFRGARRLLPVVPLYGDPVWHLYVCIGSAGQAPPCFGTIQFGHPPSKLSLACVVTGGGSACRCTTSGSWH